MEDFFIYLNLKTILSNFVEASSKDLEAPDDQQPDDWTKFSRRMGRNLAHLLLPKFFETFEGQIRYVLERFLLNLDNSQIFGIAAAVTVAQIDTQGDEAAVTITDPRTKEVLRFQMRRQPDRGAWQIDSVNYQDLKRFYKREFRNHP